MADPPPYPERDTSSDPGLTVGPPRWVKVSGIIALAIVLLLLVLLLTGGNHGPGRHQTSRGVGGPPPVRAAAEDRR